MRSDRRSILSAGILATVSGSSTALAQLARPSGLSEPVEMIDLWPGGAPGMPSVLPSETIEERSADPLVMDRAIYGINRPRMALFRPQRPNGAAVLLAPGGGFRWVVVDKEGYEMARWLAARGFTAFVLFYRLPGEGWEAGPNVALSDAQRAMRTIRHRARSFSIDPGRVAVMGFSAGGHVCADLATRFDVKVYNPIDDADILSAKPACAAPIYPVVSMDPAIAHPGSRRLLLGSDPRPASEKAHSPDRNVPEDAPPFFLLHAEDDDAVPVENTLRLHAALEARNIRREMHLFEQGGHGFGLRKAIGKPIEFWPEIWQAWARTTGLG